MRTVKCDVCNRTEPNVYCRYSRKKRWNWFRFDDDSQGGSCTPLDLCEQCWNGYKSYMNNRGFRQRERTKMTKKSEHRGKVREILTSLASDVQSAYMNKTYLDILGRIYQAESQIKALMDEGKMAEIIYKGMTDNITVKEWDLEFPDIVKMKKPYHYKDICLNVAKAIKQWWEEK